jgi:quercetin dioxygenase-like cupin family protein
MYFVLKTNNQLIKMQLKRFYFIFIFAVLSVIVFSGQRRPVTRQPASASSPQTTAPATPPAIPRAELVREELAQDMPLIFLAPEDIRWPPQQSGDRSTAPRTVILLGDPKTGGIYVTRTNIPKGKQIVPHIHSDSRTVVVLSGTYYYGIGEEFDAGRLTALPPGSFLTEPAGIPHFTWAKDGEVVIQTTAVGPSGTRLVPDRPPQNTKQSGKASPLPR